ncbi:uncharacterized protein MAM_06764 [Metarhizium album ARSEF 1941]|uniref:DUF7053 domain-containing protein n=1 Tax=Metarhizium album (strain ARSEF 1941) TaxID=1081103 RepID=A0A0B2WPS7_METAS|nr:uncharacterized protein MAM_06764 [Metarhizium album ARSEF 1941]KHN95487.1 hypothetical protein MAM_06764 [Metarhizium album ARSEF 1941]
MLRKKDVFTVITPIPGFIPRQLALDILHSHSEVITLNPLVLDHKPISAPRDAAADEFYSTWYEITQRIQFVPGMGNLGSGKITFNGCFHDMPWGLQTHVYAPFNVEMRSKYQIGGNQPGIEPPQQREIGLGAPADGLYLREDIEIKCNITMVSFVKSQAKAANKQMVQRIVKKAELLDAGVLKAMMEDGKLRTINPNDRSKLNRTGTLGHNPSPSPSIGSPQLAFQQPHTSPYQLPASPSHSYQAQQMHQAQEQAMASSYANHATPSPVELPADIQQYQYYHSQPQSQAPQPHELNLGYRRSRSSSDPLWSQGQFSLSDTQRNSVSSVLSGTSSFGHPSPGLQRTAFSPELTAHTESRDELK